MEKANLMFETIYKDKYQIIFFDFANKIMKFQLLEEAQKLSENQYINIVVKKGAELIKKYLPQKILIGIQKFNLLLSITAEKQIQNIIIEAYKTANVKKLAIMLPYYTNGQISVTQLIETDFDYSFKRNFFINEEAAILWLNKTDD